MLKSSNKLRFCKKSTGPRAPPQDGGGPNQSYQANGLKMRAAIS
jgi:hypothetical protein